jgi:hypothetical protein
MFFVPAGLARNINFVVKELKMSDEKIPEGLPEKYHNEYKLCKTWFDRFGAECYPGGAKMVFDALSDLAAANKRIKELESEDQNKLTTVLACECAETQYKLRIQELVAEVSGLKLIGQRLVGWHKKYPSSRTYSYYEMPKITKEADEIKDQMIAALSSSTGNDLMEKMKDLENVLQTLVDEGECYCLNPEECGGRSNCGWCRAVLVLNALHPTPKEEKLPATFQICDVCGERINPPKAKFVEEGCDKCRVIKEGKSPLLTPTKSDIQQIWDECDPAKEEFCILCNGPIKDCRGHDSVNPDSPKKNPDIKATASTIPSTNLSNTSLGGRMAGSRLITGTSSEDSKKICGTCDGTGEVCAKEVTPGLYVCGAFPCPDCQKEKKETPPTCPCGKTMIWSEVFKPGGSWVCPEMGHNEEEKKEDGEC